MRKLLVFIFFFLSTMAFTQGNPRIIFTQESYDFGKVKQGKIVEYTFTFENRGAEDLVIKDVTTSCGCTAALVSNSVVKPGDTGQIKVSYDSQGRAGKVSRTITVESNDPVEPVKELSITASVDASMHPGFKVNESIFSEKCSGCHFYPATGKQGKELYETVCTFCHGRTTGDLEKLRVIQKDRIDNIIRNGISGTEMPAWTKELSGPLDDEQINSLILFIKGESE